MSGNVWMFSDQIDDEDLEFMAHEFVTYTMACAYYGLGLKPLTRMAHEAGAIYKIGTKVLIRRSIFESHLREQRKESTNCCVFRSSDRMYAATSGGRFFVSGFMATLLPGGFSGSIIPGKEPAHQ